MAYMLVCEIVQFCHNLLRQYNNAAIKPSSKIELSTANDFTLRAYLHAADIANVAQIEIFYKDYLVLSTFDFINFYCHYFHLGYFEISWDDRFHIITTEDFLYWLDNSGINWDEIIIFNMSTADVAKLKEGNIRPLPRTKNARN